MASLRRDCAKSKSSFPVTSTDLPGLPTFAEVQRAIIGLGVSSVVSLATLTAWESSAFLDAMTCRFSAQEVCDRAYAEAAKALHAAKQPHDEPPSTDETFVPSEEDQRWADATSLHDGGFSETEGDPFDLRLYTMSVTEYRDPEPSRSDWSDYDAWACGVDAMIGGVE